MEEKCGSITHCTEEICEKFKCTLQKGVIFDYCGKIIKEQTLSDEKSNFKKAVKEYRPTCEEYANNVYDSAKKYGIEQSLLMAVMIQESDCNNNAINSNSIGLMQIETGDYCGKYSLSSDITSCKKDLYSPEKNIEVGSQVLKEKYNYFNNNPCKSNNDCPPKFNKYCNNGGSCGSRCNNNFCEYEFNANGVIVKSKYYSKWDASLRAYNGWGAGGDNDYVENVNKISSSLVDSPTIKSGEKSSTGCTKSACEANNKCTFINKNKCVLKDNKLTLSDFAIFTTDGTPYYITLVNGNSEKWYLLPSQWSEVAQTITFENEKTGKIIIDGGENIYFIDDAVPTPAINLQSPTHYVGDKINGDALQQEREKSYKIESVKLIQEFAYLNLEITHNCDKVKYEIIKSKSLFGTSLAVDDYLYLDKSVPELSGELSLIPNIKQFNLDDISDIEYGKTKVYAKAECIQISDGKESIMDTKSSLNFGEKQPLTIYGWIGMGMEESVRTEKSEDIIPNTESIVLKNPTTDEAMKVLNVELNMVKTRLPEGYITSTSIYNGILTTLAGISAGTVQLTKVEIEDTTRYTAKGTYSYIHDTGQMKEVLKNADINNDKIITEQEAEELRVKVYKDA